MDDNLFDNFDGDETNSTFDSDYEDYYWTALNAEAVLPVTRTFEEWRRLSEPITKDDLLDTMLFIKRIKETSNAH